MGMTMEQFAAEIADVQDMIPSPNLLIHGTPGSGKTSLAAALPDAFMLALDPGWSTARSRGFHIQTRRIPDYDTIMAGLHWLEAGGYRNHRWLVCDGLNIFSTRLTQQFATAAHEANPAKRVSPEQPDKPDYFRAQNVVKNMVARLCDLPIPVVFTCHSEQGDTEEGETWVRPAIDGREYKVGNFICGLMNCIGYMAQTSVNKAEKGQPAEREQVTRVLWNQYHDERNSIRYMAKDQLGVFPVWTDNLSAVALDEYVTGGAEVKEEQPKVAAAGRSRRPNVKAQLRG